MMRKHTLEYDDVMNKQRQEIYSFRNETLRAEDIEPLAIEVLESVCMIGAERFFQSRSEEGGWDPEGYRQWLMHLFPVTFDPQEFDQEYLDVEQIETIASKKVIQTFKDKLTRENLKVPAQLAAEGEPSKPAHGAVRNLMIRRLDQMWQEHLLRMDHLRSDVTLRAVGQRDPLTEFKHEAFAMFDELGRNLRTEIAAPSSALRSSLRSRRCSSFWLTPASAWKPIGLSLPICNNSNSSNNPMLATSKNSRITIQRMMNPLSPLMPDHASVATISATVAVVRNTRSAVNRPKFSTKTSRSCSN